MLKKLLIASGNKGKIKEIKDLLKDLNIEILSLKDIELDNIEEPEETSKTFAENSLIKAKYYAEKSGYFTLSDDSGLCVKALNNDPGIYSARWAGANKDFNYAMNLIKSKLDETNTEDYSANFTCVVTLYNPDKNEAEYFEGIVDGDLTFPPRGNGGFGYDPIFIPKGYNETFAELPLEVKQKISHRANALKKLKESLSK